jgi:hypothetical protein
VIYGGARLKRTDARFFVNDCERGLPSMGVHQQHFG